MAWMAGHIELYDQGYAYQTLENKRQVSKLLGFSNTAFTTNAEALAAYEHDKADPFDPMKWITTVDGTDYLYGWSVPIKFFYGTADTILPQFDYVKRFHQALNHAGFACELMWYEGFSHQDVASAANEQCRNDMLVWFEEQNLHLHNYVPNVTDPTCTEKGYTTYTCTCGDSYVDSYVDALGHDYSAGLCTVCGEDTVTALLDGNVLALTGDAGRTDGKIFAVILEAAALHWRKQNPSVCGKIMPRRSP